MNAIRKSANGGEEKQRLTTMAQLIQRTYVTDPRVGGISAAEIIAVEKQLGIALPAGYDAWMQTFGPGVFEHFITVAAPADLMRERCDATPRLEKRGFMEYRPANAGKDALTIAKSHDGDLLLLLPREPGKLYFLPRHGDSVIALAHDLAAALEVMLNCSNGDLPPCPVFVPDQDCFERHFALPLGQQPLAQLRAALSDQVPHDLLLDDPDDCFKAFYLYSQSFYGTILCNAGEQNLAVFLACPTDQVDHLAPVLACLKALGFMNDPLPLTAAEQLEHERIVYVTHNYQYLAQGRYRDVSLSRTRPTAPQTQLYAQLMHEFPDQILFNPCPHCGLQRRTPRAKQCLNCGTRTQG